MTENRCETHMKIDQARAFFHGKEGEVLQALGRGFSGDTQEVLRIERGQYSAILYLVEYLEDPDASLDELYRKLHEGRINRIDSVSIMAGKS